MQMNVEQAALSTTPTTYLLFHCIFHHPEIKSVYLNHPKILPETCYAFLPPDKSFMLLRIFIPCIYNKCLLEKFQKFHDLFC